MSESTLLRLFGELMDLEPVSREEKLRELKHLDGGLAAELGSLLGADSRSAEILVPLDRAFPRAVDEPEPVEPGVAGTVGSYQVGPRIGGGGMGVVYRARDLRTGRDVALKFLSGLRVQDATARARFRNEARAAARLDHPNICPVHEYAELPDGRPFIAMALVEGRTLKERIAEGPLPLDEASEIAIQAARGLDHAHRAGLVHRDVTPSNLLRTPDGVLKILDFGVAKQTGGDALTAKGMSLGTIGYMAPEQITADPVDARTDVWALGVVLFEMLAGVNPFRGAPYETIAASLSAQPRRALRELRPDVPPALEAAVERCLRREPGERYPSAAALAADLERLRGPSRKTVAIVEDNRDNRLLLQAFLGERYRIVEYDNGPAALEGIRRERPDLVLMDVSLPGMDGLEVLARLRSDAELGRMPVVALTAHAMRGDRERFLAAGFDDYVAKPIVDETVLLAAVERCLR